MRGGGSVKNLQMYIIAPKGLRYNIMTLAYNLWALPQTYTYTRSDTYVTSESGTGVVHQAPGFGEDDFRVALKYGILKKGETVVCPVDASGRFTDEVTDFKGKYVKVKINMKSRCVQSYTCMYMYMYMCN